jgi:kynureninase
VIAADTSPIDVPVPDRIRALDAGDPLRAMRDRFQIPEGLVYLDGNSLGALPVATPERLRRAIEDEWGRSLIGSWNDHDWIGAPQRIGAMIAPLIGARPNEVIVADSTSANLFKLIVAALAARPGRTTILSEPGNFPTDLYIADGAASLLPGRQLKTVPADQIADAIDDDVAIVVLTHVHYKTGRKLDMTAITAAAHAKGALMLWDLSHSIGAVKVDLNGCHADLAVGCGYKYLNGGPGAPAFLYVAEALQEGLRSPLTGWMGHAAPFAFDDGYAPALGIDRFLCGTPPILGMAGLEQGVALFADVTIDHLCAGMGFDLVTPRDPAQRGSHVSFAHAQAWPICRALIERGVVGDFRAPDVLRMGFTPLYTRFEDVWRAVEATRAVMIDGAWEDMKEVRAAVT